MKNYNRIRAHELAVRSNSQYLKATEAEDQNKKVERKKNIMIRKIVLSIAFILTLIYLCLVGYDAWIMAPILRVFTINSMALPEARVPVVIGVYVLLAMGFTFLISKGFLKKMSIRVREMEEEFAVIASPEKAFSQVKRETARESNLDFIIALIAFLVFIIGVVVVLAVTRNYLNPSHQLHVRISSPIDWSAILMPIITAIAMFFAGIYKEVIIRFVFYLYKTFSLSNRSQSLYHQAQLFGQEAIEYDQEATNLYEEIQKSKELQEVINRYLSSSAFTKRQQVITVKVQKTGVPVAHCQIQGITLKDEYIYDVTNREGMASLKWNVDDYLKKILVKSFPLSGDRFEAGQILVVELDSIDTTEQKKFLN